MPCPTHSHTPAHARVHARGEDGRRLATHRRDAARPPQEQATVERQTQQLSERLQPIHAAILAGVIGAGAGGFAQIPLAPLSAVRQAISLRFAQRGQAFRDQFDELAFIGAEQGRTTAVRRYGLDVSPTFGDRPGGSVTDLPRGNPVRSELERSADRARSQVQPRMIDDISRAIHEASEAGLSREEIHDQLRRNGFEHARDVEARRIAQTEIPAAANRGALAAYEEANSVATKQWVAILDSRTRRTHRDVSGASVPLSATFDVGGHEARWPGDYRLPASERINCRCFVTPG